MTSQNPLTTPTQLVGGCVDDCRMADTPVVADLSTDRRRVLTRRVRLLVAATITYTVIEGTIAISAGTIAGSTALIGFGLDDRSVFRGDRRVAVLGSEPRDS